MVSYSGLFDTVQGQGGTGEYELSSGRSPNRYHLARILKKRGMREYSEVLKTLTGAASGSGASVTNSQVQAVANTAANVQGGVRTIESKELVGLILASDKDDASANTTRNTTAADVTSLVADMHDGSYAARSPSTYVADASGNGGGGKGETI